MSDEYLTPPQYFQEKVGYLPSKIYQKKLHFNTSHIYHLETTDLPVGRQVSIGG